MTLERKVTEAREAERIRQLHRVTTLGSIADHLEAMARQHRAQANKLERAARELRDDRDFSEYRAIPDFVNQDEPESDGATHGFLHENDDGDFEFADEEPREAVPTLEDAERFFGSKNYWRILRAFPPETPATGLLTHTDEDLKAKSKYIGEITIEKLDEWLVHHGYERRKA